MGISVLDGHLGFAAAAEHTCGADLQAQQDANRLTGRPSLCLRQPADQDQGDDDADGFVYTSQLRLATAQARR
jgi:hypothetical protein